MGFLSLLSYITPNELVYYGIVTICVIIVLLVMVGGIRRQVRQYKEYVRVMRGGDKNLPESFSVMTTDGVRLTLGREWIDGEWRYVLDKLSYRFGPPDKEKERLAKTTPRALRMSLFDKKVLDNMDNLTMPGGEYDEVAKLRYELQDKMAKRIAGPAL